jgi:leucyl aminopeptidase
MNFDLKTLELTAAATEKCDLLVVLVPEGFKPGQDALSVLAAHAIKQWRSEGQGWQTPAVYLAPAVSARKALVLLGAGNGSARAMRQACKPLRQLSSCLRSSER